MVFGRILPQLIHRFLSVLKLAHNDYENFPIHISIWRAKTDLTQTGDDRDGGVLLIDDEDAVLGISLFKYDNEPLATRFFGEVKIGRFRKLLEKEEAVLSEERVGLVAPHPFCRDVIGKIEKRIGKAVKEESLRRQKEIERQTDPEEATRYKKAFNILNEIAEVEAQVAINLGQKPTSQAEKPPNGFCLYPSSAEITVSKRYNFELRLLSKIVHYGSVVKATCTNTRIRVLTPEIKITSKVLLPISCRKKPV